ncbi:adenylosuccinate lyase family protein [Paracoccus gahaiensis]|uniref:Adenylosuccinate lyase family protein n=1 Tax=Paracoccus gahaiensis TaxID=1706839 RepID=A0A4U0R795_9RHOB|nr:lyase family protein [Paracoccus gahaiensis]TJZ90933.1 adenylosuccinate lyase family protein [Paracoccus gahaiensis]
MTGPGQSPIYAGLFGDPDSAALLSPEAELRAMIRVEAALAQVQADLGVIPAEAGRAIAAICAGAAPDPAALGPATTRNGVPVPGLVAALRARMEDSPQAQYLHWGATSQDIVDSALALRLRDVLALWQSRLDAVLGRLAAMAADHADLAMAARTYGQVATPTSFGAIVAGWGRPLLHHRQDLDRVRSQVLRLSLSGAAGTLAAMGPEGPQVRAGLARALDLADPGFGWHSDRSGPGVLADWCAALAASLGKLAEDLLLMTQSGLDLVRIEGAGASSTMPQKQNPVGPSAMVALSRHALGLADVFRAAGLHRQNRDGAAWFTEWLTLPPLTLGVGALLLRADEVLGKLSPDARAMQRDLGAGQGTIHAEALSFALSETRGMDRVAALGQVASLCLRALASGVDLLDLAATEWPGEDWHRRVAARSLGTAPDEARAFAAALGPAAGGPKPRPSGAPGR